MRTQLLSVITAGAMLFAFGGCGEVDQCTEGTTGCLNGPSDQGSCLYGLIADSAGICVSKAKANEPFPNPCGCGAHEICQTDGTCTNACQPLAAPVAHSEALPACRAPKGTAAYSYEQASIAACQQECARRNTLCGTGCDPKKDCTSNIAVAFMTALCPGQMAECAMKRCEEVRDRPCAQQNCPGNAQPNCAGVVCSNSCASNTESFNYDGICDDGDLSNASYAACAWGTDCADCGPRRGAPPPTIRQLGQQCVDAYQCGAKPTDFSDAIGWCVPSATQPSVQRCMPDCTTSKRCPAGFMCQELEFSSDGAAAKPLLDANNVAGRACFPMMCTN